MRFEFSSSPTSEGLSLPVLKEIPDGPIVWIEGRNGIGKSLSVRLLDLATGGTPYATDAQAWRSLLDSTGPISIRATDANTELRLELDPGEWDTDPLKQSWDGLGSAYVNGMPAGRADVTSRLRVVRIGGEEGLARAVGSQFLQLASQVGLHAEAMVEASTQADQVLTALVDLLDAASPARTASAGAELSRAENALRQTVDALGPVADRLRVVERAIEAAESLEALHAKGPGLQAQLDAFETDLADAHRRRERAVSDLTAAAASRPDARATTELSRIERLVATRERAADKAAATVTGHVSVAGVPPNYEAIAAAKQEIARDLDSATSRRAELARADAVRAFLSALLDLLDRSPELDPRAVLLDVGGQALTRELLQDTAQARRADLDATDVAQEIDEVDVRLRSLVEQNEAINALSDALHVLAHKRELVRDALASLEELEAGLEGARDAFRAARERLDTAVADAERLTLDKQEAERALAALAKGWTEQELLEQISAAGEPAARLPMLRDELRETEIELRFARDGAQREVDEAKLLSAEAVADSDQSRRVLTTSPDWSWLRSALSIPDEWTMDWVTRARRAVAVLKDTVTAAPRSIRAIETGLRDLARHVSDGHPLGAASSIGSAVITACEERVRDEFMTPAIRVALVGGADIEAVDLRNPSLSWEEAGLRIIRPFSAFSSGEQAFAYARARIEQVQRRGDEHLVLVLDEFSAFIAGDRRRLLNRLLAERIDEGTVSQVLLIVPLTQDYVQLAADAGEDASPSLTQHASEIIDRGYFTEVVTE